MEAISGLDTVWVLMAAFLVFLMHAGFAMLEAGFTQAKNSVNIILKNFMGVSTGMLAFLVLGFGLMFGAGTAVYGSEFFGMSGIPEAWGSIPTWAFFLFQAVFAATAATIVSGAVAERTKFGAYVIFSVILTAFTYPIVGHWIWSGGGWLAERGFLDFAGSTVVHSVGGWAALAGIILIGSRVGRFKKGYAESRFSGHSIPLAALGVFILWFGWFGFNPGSQLAAEGAENAIAIATVAVNTQLAAASGAIAAVFLGWMMSRRIKAGFALNGALAGLVAITAPCAFVSAWASVVIGLIGGAVMILVTGLLEKAKLDDAVGAVPVHLGAGVWGTLSVGFFALDGGLFYGGGASMLGTQAIGVLAVGAWTFSVSMLVFGILKATMGIRASEKEEMEGLDLKHGQAAYPDFGPYLMPAEAGRSARPVESHSREEKKETVLK